jgi:hypothetical protein
VLSFPIAVAASRNVRAGSTGAWLPPHATRIITASTAPVARLIAPNTNPRAYFKSFARTIRRIGRS